MIVEKGYNLSNIYLVPRQISEINSRNDVDTSVEFCGNKLSLPLIASPMPDVCDGKMAKELYQRGLFGFIHRFNTIDKQLKEYSDTGIADCGCAIGINGEWWDRFLRLLDIGVTDFLIDTANGFNRRVGECIEKILNKSPNVNIIAGNVATKEGYRFLAQYPLAAIRCMIGSGCFIKGTKINTKDGLKNIEKIRIGEEVLTHTGEYKKVIATTTREEKERIIDINGIKCTQNHKFYVLNKKYKNIINDENINLYAEWVSAKDLSDDYYLLKITENTSSYTD